MTKIISQDTPEIAISQKVYKATSRKYNLSSYFLLPIILEKGIKTKGFINSYLYNTNDALSMDNCLYVLMNSLNIDLTKNKYYLTDIKVKEGYLYTFDLNRFKNDLNLFIEGKYSKFSQELKDILCTNQSTRPEMNSDIYKVLYKTDDKRKRLEELIGQRLHDDAELCSSCNIEEEMWYEG